jgi:hypothetical protein
MCSTEEWTTQRATVRVHPLLRSRCSGLVEEVASGGNSSEGNPSGASAAPLTQVQTQTAQDTAQGDAAIPLETRARQRTDAERQRAAREAALGKLNRERQQKSLRDPQELRHGSVDTRTGVTDHRRGYGDRQ